MSFAQASLPKPGDVIAGKYRVGRTLGSGGMGVVVEATHLKLDQRVAIKLLKTSAVVPEAAARLEREARVAARLRTPHVARVTDVDVTPSGVPYIVMEYLDGHDLGQELQSRGVLPVAEAVAWMLEICSAMAEAHALGIVHRDLKPSNLFLAQEDGRRRVKVLDFGISKVATEEQMTTLTRSVLGTPQYMSPEQVRSAKHVDWRTDIWSLGVVLYELLAGQLPFEGDTPTAVAASIVADVPRSLHALREEVPKALETAVMKALAKDVSDRFDSVRAFAQAIAPFSDAECLPPISSRSGRRAQATVSSTPASERETTPPSWSDDTDPSTPAKPKLPYLAAALALVLCSVGAVLWFRSSDQPAGRETAPLLPSSSPPVANAIETVAVPSVPTTEPATSPPPPAKAAPPRPPPKRAPTKTPGDPTSSSPKPPPLSRSSDPLYL
jgi:serine/threonine-protein kinase